MPSKNFTVCVQSARYAAYIEARNHRRKNYTYIILSLGSQPYGPQQQLKVWRPKAGDSVPADCRRETVRTTSWIITLFN